MNAPFTLEDIISRNMNPEKLPTLERVFKTACEEASIPESAESERSELAEKLLAAGATTVGTTESEPLLMSYARRVVAHYRH
jgi:hypothetical protein